MTEGAAIKTVTSTLLGLAEQVSAATGSDCPPKHLRPMGSAVDEFEDAIQEDLQQVPTMSATVAAERAGLDTWDYDVQTAWYVVVGGVGADSHG